MMELLVEKRDPCDDCVELLLSLSATPNHHAKSGVACEFSARSRTFNAVVLLRSHICHVVSVLVHKFPVKELFSVECALL